MRDILAIYLRLSDEDRIKNANADSNSISNQRKLIEDYIHSKPDLSRYDIMEFSDDGFSGTNFQRPGIQRMLNLVKEKRVKCIVVKDFSRFGRNYILVGKYLEEIFPFLGVRFISVNDRFDSKFDDAVGALDVGFKNIMHDYYSKITSAKIAQAYRFRAEQGTLKLAEFYGYMKDGKGGLLINPETAKYVRQIFEWRIEGFTMPDIARCLNSVNAPVPRSKKEVYSKYWRANTVYHILHNEKYTGKYVFGKTKSVNYKSVCADESNWIVFENAFEPIISKEEFEQVCATFYKKTKKPEIIHKHALSGKIKCCGCGASMYRDENGNYYCKSGFEIERIACTEAKIKEAKFEDIILTLLNKYIELVSKEHKNNVVSGTRSVKKKIQSEIKRINATVMALYEDYANGKISREEHMTRREEIGHKKELLEMQLAEYEAEESAVQEKLRIVDKLKADTESGFIEKLTPEIVKEFVNKITVYDENRIEILWNFTDMFSGIEGK